MMCASELTPDSDTCKSMVASSNPMATVKHVKLYFGICVSHMSTPFKEDFVPLNEDITFVTLYGIASGLTIQVTGTVKYVVIVSTGKPYTMMVETYWCLNIQVPVCVMSPG